jgi:hypothetical protein
MEQRMPEHRRFAQAISLEESLPEEAKRLRKQAQGTPPGIERERLVRRARQLERQLMSPVGAFAVIRRSVVMEEVGQSG